MAPLLLLLLLLLLMSFLTATHCSCDDESQGHILSLAFSSVSGFQPPQPPAAGGCIRHVHLPSQNLSGSVSWSFLRNITTLESLDLSGNALEGSIPGSFWTSPALTELNLASNSLGGPLRFERSKLRFLNLSGNRFTAASNLRRLPCLRILDLSRNKLGFTPQGMRSLPNIQYLDLSGNSMEGEFPRDFPAIAELRFLNVARNNLSGEVNSEVLGKFGSSAFAKGGVFTYSKEARGEENKERKKGKRRKAVIAAAAASAGGVVIVGAVIAGVTLFRRKRSPEKETAEEEEEGWVREARPGAAVVLFEKPLMELTFGDLAEATSGFGRESLMAEGGRGGPIYRAVLPGELHVAIRLSERDRALQPAAAAAAFQDLGRLRHPNLLPLLGYCISGREKLLLYEYMERGDLHRWLHELPAGSTDVEDWTGDTWEGLPGDTSITAVHWPARHRIAVGIARGLAFLHQGWVGSHHAPAVHGRLLPSNILLSDDLEPRIADFSGGGSGIGATAEDDVYSYGLIVLELVTGRRSPWHEEEVERLRAVVRDGSPDEVSALVDQRLPVEAEWEREAAECLRVGYLCTAKIPAKRPSMQQVVALLKEIRPDTGSSSSHPP